MMSRRTVLWLMVVLDALVLGGCVTLLLVRDLLLRIMNRLVSGDAAGEILNVLDHLIPYYVVYAAVLFVLLLISGITAVAFLKRPETD